MKFTVLALTASLTACGMTPGKAAARQAFAMNSDALDIDLRPLEPGADYPYDAPLPPDLENKKALVIKSDQIHGGPRLIIVDSNAELSNPLPGEDFPTDSPMPPSMAGKVVLALENHHRFLIDIQPARAGIDFPTEIPSSRDRKQPVWVFSGTNRIPVFTIRKIKKPKAGVDYPTDGYVDLYRDFYVAVILTAEGFERVRIP